MFGSLDGSCPAVAMEQQQVPELFTIDEQRPLQVEVISRYAGGDALVTDISYDHAAGGRALASVVTPGRAVRAGVIIAHGGSADGRRFFLDEAVALAGRGFAVLLTAISFPDHGDAEVTAHAVRVAVSTQRRGLDVLTTWVGVDPARLGFFGHSGGAFQGAILSAVEPRFAAIVLASYGSGTLLRLAAEELRGQGVGNARPYLDVLHRFDPVAYVATPGRRHLLFQHGVEDQTVPRAEAVAAYAAAVPPRTWREYPCGHGTDADPQARRDRAEFFCSMLSPDDAPVADGQPGQTLDAESASSRASSPARWPASSRKPPVRR